MSIKSFLSGGVLFSFLLIFATCKDTEENNILKVAINAGPEGEALKTLAPQYDKMRIQVIELPYATLREQLITALGENRPTFDVVMIDDPWFPQLAPQLTTLVNIPDSLINDLVPATVRLCRIPYGNGDLRALPLVGNTQLLFYRNDILLKYGVKNVPTDWSGVAKIAKDVSARRVSTAGPRVYGYAIRGRAGAPIVTDFLPIYWSLGGRLVDDVGNPSSGAVDGRILAQSLKIYRELKDASPPGAANYDWSEMTSAFTNGFATMQLNWPAAIPVIDSAILSQTGHRGWSVAMPPGMVGRPGTSMIGNWLVSVPKSSKHQKEAEEFIVWVMEQQERVASAGNPPTRISVLDKLAKKPGSEYFGVIREALENSTPRVRSEHWAQIEDAVSRCVSGFLSGQLQEDDAIRLLTAEIDRVFK